MSVSDTTASVTLHPSAPSVARFGPFRFDRVNRILSRDGVELNLPPRVLGVLEFLLERRNKVVSKQTLIDAVWNGSFVSETSLTEAISLLRQALDDDSQDPHYIQTLHRRGYRFIAPVSFEPEPRAVVAAGRVSSHRGWPLRWMAAGTALIAVGVAAFVAGRTAIRAKPPQRAPVHLAITLPAGAELPTYVQSLAISPDGRDVVFVAVRDGERQLFHRPVASAEARLIDGSLGAFAPFFSPDGRWIAFFAEGKLKKVSLQGGAPAVLLETSKGMSGDWGDDGTMVVSTGVTSGLSRISETGRQVETLTRLEPARGEVGHFWPRILPGGKKILFTSWSSTLTTATIEILSVDTGRRRTLIRGGAFPLYAPSGHLIYAQPGVLISVPFDAERGELTGAPVTIADQVLTQPFTGLAHAAISRSGDLLYAGGPSELLTRELAWLSREGKESAIPAPPRFYRNLKVSPDGKRLAVTILEQGRSDIWVVALPDGSLTRLTFDGFNIEPVWSPDGTWVAFASSRDGAYNLYRKAASGAGDLERLVTSRHHQYPFSWAGDTILYSETTEENGFDLWLLDQTGPAQWKARPFAVSKGLELHGRFSPDGKWVVYASTESGNSQIYLRRTDSPGKWQVSLEEAYEPFWSVDGGTIYFYADQGLQAADAKLDGAVQISKPRLVTKRDDLALIAAASHHRFVVIREREKQRKPQHIDMVIGWPALLD
jgi:Tol biopolymer transport system component/DNA-binding winged helix-turn-helix (wHTH) protein